MDKSGLKMLPMLQYFNNTINPSLLAPKTEKISKVSFK